MFGQKFVVTASRENKRQSRRGDAAGYFKDNA
jgi:hypothetical protein